MPTPSVVHIVIDDSTSKIITGTYEYDHANGGTLVVPAGNGLPVSDTTAGELYWDITTSGLYRRNDANTDWEAMEALIAPHASTHESGGDDEIQHDNLVGSGSNTHSQIDTHIADGTIHFTEATIDHVNIQNIGTNTHAQIDTHIADLDKHREINDLGLLATELWSALKISTELAGKTDIGHTHTESDITDLTHYTSLDFDTDFSGKTTSDLTEGTNLYYTEGRVSANVDVAANTAARHTHANKALLDSLTDAGLGTNYLADDGIYKTIDHTTLSNIGTNTHAQIDSHISDGTIHFTEGSVSHLNISDIGSNTHAQIDTHIADAGKHREINDSSTSTTELWSSDKISTEITSAASEKVEWRGNWTSTTYYENDMVFDDGWTMIANTTTTEKAAPDAIGVEQYVYTGTSPTTTTAAKTLIYGTKYTPSQPYFLNGYRIYTVVGNLYTVYYTVENQTTELFSFTGLQSGWREFSLNPKLVLDGTELVLSVLVKEPDPAPAEWTANYEYVLPNNGTPTAGQIVHPSKPSSGPPYANIIRVHKTDDDAIDQSANLAGMAVGDVINGPNLSWSIQAISDEGTYVEFQVAPAQQDVAGTHNFSFETVSTKPITVVVDPSFWSTNADIESLYSIDGSAPAITQDAYGVDLLVQPAYISPDWDLVSYGGTVAGGGSSGGDLTDAPSDGSFYGRKDALWVNPAIADITGLTDSGPGTNYLSDDGTYKAIDHGDLSGLLADDHTQYLLIDGTRAMTGDLSMGNNSISGINSAAFNTSFSAPAHSEGLTFYDNVNKCLAYYNENSEMTLCIGREFVFRVYNDSGSTITNGSGCYINGADSGVPTVELLNAAEYSESRILGVATVDIPNGSFGYVAFLGEVNDIDTSSWSVGTILYADPATPGAFTSTIPTGENFIVRIGVVTISDAATGRVTIFPFANEYTTETVNITGWPGINEVTISFDDGTRTLSLGPYGGNPNFRFYQDGVKYTKTSDSIVIPDTEGLFIVYYNEGTLLYTQDPNFGQISTLIRNNPLVAYVYWNATDSQYEYLGNETHGFVMDSSTHSYLHFTQGAQYITGLGLTDIITDASGDVTTHAQFGVESGVITDEDYVHFPITFGSTTGLDCYYMVGTEANPSLRRDTTSGYSVVNTGTGRLAYNELTGGNWQLTEVNNNDFVLIHVFANNAVDSTRRTIALLGQNEYPNAGQARAGAEQEIKDIVTSGLVGPELVPVATVIFQTSNGYSNPVKARVRSTDLGDDYIDWRTTDLLGGGGSSGYINPTFADDQFKIIDNLDNTKELQFQLANITTATTRVFTAPDVNGTLVTTGNLSDVDHTQISNIGTNTHAQIDTHIADGTIHFTEGSIDHTAIQNIGTNTHAQIDTHISDSTIHFTEASISHLNIADIGSNSHAVIDTHIADGTIHYTQAAISIPASQISDFDTEVSNNTDVAANTAERNIAKYIYDKAIVEPTDTVEQNGPERVPDPNFKLWSDSSVPDGWTKGGTHDANNYVAENSGGGFRFVSDSTLVFMYIANRLSAGVDYRVEINVESITGQCIFRLADTDASTDITITSAGMISVDRTAFDGYMKLQRISGQSCDVVIRSINIYEIRTVPRNDENPIYKARQNDVISPNDLTGWGQGNTANGGIYDLIGDTSNDAHYRLQTLSGAIGESRVFSAEYNIGDKTWSRITIVDSSVKSAYVNIIDGVFGTISGIDKYRIKKLQDGWCEVKVQIDEMDTASPSFRHYAADDDADVVFIGDGSTVNIQVRNSHSYPGTIEENIGFADGDASVYPLTIKQETRNDYIERHAAGLVRTFGGAWEQTENVDNYLMDESPINKRAMLDGGLRKRADNDTWESYQAGVEYEPIGVEFDRESIACVGDSITNATPSFADHLQTARPDVDVFKYAVSGRQVTFIWDLAIQACGLFRWRFKESYYPWLKTGTIDTNIVDEALIIDQPSDPTSSYLNLNFLPEGKEVTIKVNVTSLSSATLRVLTANGGTLFTTSGDGDFSGTYTATTAYEQAQIQVLGGSTSDQIQLNELTVSLTDQSGCGDTCVLFAGINDLISGGDSTEDINSARRFVINQFQESGRRALLGYVMPFYGNSNWTQALEDQRLEINSDTDNIPCEKFNTLILGFGNAMREEYVGADDLHPNATGQIVLGEELEKNLFGESTVKNANAVSIAGAEVGDFDFGEVGKRLVLTTEENLLKESNDLRGAVGSATWSHDQTIASTNANDFVANSTATLHKREQVIEYDGGTYTFAHITKNLRHDWVRPLIFSGNESTAHYLYVNTTTGATGNSTGLSDSRVMLMPDGKYLIIIEADTTAGTGSLAMSPAGSGTSTTYVGSNNVSDPDLYCGYMQLYKGTIDENITNIITTELERQKGIATILADDYQIWHAAGYVKEYEADGSGDWIRIEDVTGNVMDESPSNVVAMLAGGLKKNVSTNEWELPVTDTEYYSGKKDSNGDYIYYMEFQKTYTVAGTQTLLSATDWARIINCGGYVESNTEKSALGHYRTASVYSGAYLAVTTNDLRLNLGSVVDDIGDSCDVWFEYTKT